ncbi:MAG: winged helix-turn-helix domain-containing protein [Acidimicrobiia bacterium]
MIVIAEDPEVRLRDIAARIGITERAVQRIVAELEEAGYLTHDRIGRRNRYRIQPGTYLRHELDGVYQVKNLLDLFVNR